MANTPLEVQILIIEWVYRLSQSRAVDHRTLRACALVCHAWTPTAQRLLFRRVPYASHFYAMNGGATITRLIRTLRTCPHLSAAVRYISLEVDMVEEASKRSDGLTLLELCPQVQGIDIADHISTDTMYPALEARLRAMELHPVLLYPSGSSSFVALLLRTWPNLRVLRLEDEANEALPPISVTGALQVLSIFDLHSNGWLSSPENDFTALRHLELIATSWHDARWDQLLISAMIRQLLSLRVVGHFPPQDFLGRLEHLESLAFSTLPRQDIVLPKSLRHVGFHRGAYDTSPNDAMDFVVAALRPLANLQLVTTTRLATEAHIKALEEICRDRAVVLEVRQKPEDFPNPRYDVDWI
ncbi:hypothetical protein FA95DRAFT_1608510 [Auriscalpium vulgare]|uniref:Uncharacterized protein n=1 Tax=Auriscalpium vulgare TaxID=40419 RepID=A0ACB8RJN5_9AGAM|nr:hypothetical protein FA95DRAFT_1608510 [Auriscalpium vulgare]